jgi:hypothetical protein
MHWGLCLIVSDTGIEPATSSVSGKRATAAPIAQVYLVMGISEAHDEPPAR